MSASGGASRRVAPRAYLCSQASRALVDRCSAKVEHVLKEEDLLPPHAHCGRIFTKFAFTSFVLLCRYFNLKLKSFKNYKFQNKTSDHVRVISKSVDKDFSKGSASMCTGASAELSCV